MFVGGPTVMSKTCNEMLGCVGLVVFVGDILGFVGLILFGGGPLG